MTARELLKGLIPPAVLELRRPHGPRIWEGVYPTFADAPKRGLGFDNPRYWRAALQEAREALASSARPDGLRGWEFDEDQLVGTLAGAVASENGNRCILDFGGGAGVTYVRVAQALPSFGNLRYHVVDRPWAVTHAAPLYDDDSRVRFYAELPDLEAVDLLVLKGTLNYCEDYSGLLRQLSRYEPTFIFLGHLYAGPFQTFASTQTNFGPDSVPLWFFNTEEIVHLLASLGYRLASRAKLGVSFDQGNFPPGQRMEGGHPSALLFRRERPDK